MKEINMTRDEYIDYLSRKTNIISTSFKNSKTGPLVLDLAMPAGVTCRPDAPCLKGCYACKGTQKMCRVLGAYYRNYRIYRENPDNFFEQFYYSIKFNGLPFVRVFDSGDIPDADFFRRLCEMCEKLPDVRFMGFTKKYEIVNDYLDSGKTLPENLNIIFSAWDKDWKFSNPHNLCVAYVDFGDERTPDIPSASFKCPGRTSTCSACRVCWNKKLKAVTFKIH